LDPSTDACTYGAGRIYPPEAGKLDFLDYILFFPFPPARNASQREAGGDEISNEQSATPKRET